MVVLRSLVCLVIQPALFFGMIKLAELTGTIAQATFVGSTMPPATLSFMFAQQHATYETESVARFGHIDRASDRRSRQDHRHSGRLRLRQWCDRLAANRRDLPHGPRDIAFSVECGTVDQAARSVKHLRALI